MRFITKITSNEDQSKINRYFLRGTPFVLEKKIWDINFKSTFVLGIRVSHHEYKNQILKNKLNILELLSGTTQPATGTIDIIVPVYNGFEYLENLFTSIKENTDIDYNLFVVNDASPDDRVLPFLEKQLSQFGTKMTLIKNKKNLGFLKSVNLALQKTSNHVILLNTDVVLPKNWASKLIYPILQDSRVASVTPFSNCATIFSIPEFGDNNFVGDLESVNRAISYINAPFNKLKFPTGVGFCMAMNRDAIKKVGILDEIFERGYGEENDWCQRAVKHGFYHTIAANLFVWHKHGASFGKEKIQLIERHMQIIKKRYPRYLRDVHNIQQDEIYSSLREIVNILVINAVAPKTQVWFCHNWGGGATVYAHNKISEAKQDCLCIELQANDTKLVRLLWYYQNHSGAICINYNDLHYIISQIKIDALVVNNLASWPDIPTTLGFISDIKRNKKCNVSFRGHDFIPICPSICLLNNDNRYCNIKSFSQCKNCGLRLDTQNIVINDLTGYQSAWRRFFYNTCDELILFSDSTYKIYSTLFPDAKQKMKIIPHVIPDIRKAHIPAHTGLNIAILGAISVQKGLNIVKQMDKLLANHPNIKIKIVGYTQKNLFDRITQTGLYTPADLPEIMEKHNIDIIFIPSIWPETFSYTTQEAMQMGMRVACFNLGAPAERVKHYDNGLVIDKIDAQYALDKIIKFCSTKKA